MDIKQKGNDTQLWRYLKLEDGSNYRRRADKQSGLRIFVRLLAIMIVIGICVDVLWVNHLVTAGRAEVPAKADVIFILAGDVIDNVPGKETSCRLEKGLQLYRNGYADKIIVTGGLSKMNTIPSGEAMKNYLLSKGVPEDDILVEDKATNTYEHFVYAKPIVEKYNFKDAIIVTSHYHLERALASARVQGYKVSGAASEMPEIKGSGELKYLIYWIREVPAVIKNYIRYGVPIYF